MRRGRLGHSLGYGLLVLAELLLARGPDVVERLGDMLGHLWQLP